MEFQEKGTHIGNIINTLLISFSAFALVFNYLSPEFSLLELSQKYEVDILVLCGHTTTVCTLAFFIGGVSGIQMYDHVNRQLVSYILLLLMGIGTLLLPIVISFQLFLYTGALVGYAAMAYWTLQVIWMMETVMSMVGRPLFFSKVVEEDDDDEEEWDLAWCDDHLTEEGYTTIEEVTSLPFENSYEIQEAYDEKPHTLHDSINNNITT